MIDFFFLVPIAIGMGLAGLASFMWTLKSGQYDDLEGAAARILFEGNEGPVVEEKHSAPSKPEAEGSEFPKLPKRGANGGRRPKGNDSGPQSRVS
jgi:cbb3-type cytochrome oxidase maturation protein